MIQAKKFAESVEITDIMIAKLDGTAKGGIAFSVAKEIGTPISYIGTGEKATDLAEFQTRNVRRFALLRRGRRLLASPPSVASQRGQIHV